VNVFLLLIICLCEVIVLKIAIIAAIPLVLLFSRSIFESNMYLYSTDVLVRVFFSDCN